MFKYDFMITAFIVGMLLSVVIPLVGTQVVFKRLAMTGDALSHTAIAGVAIGLILGYNPLIFAIIASVISVLIIELFRKRFYKYSELSISIVLSLGIGLTGILSYYTPAANLNNYLFGTIFGISDLEFYLTLGLFAYILITYALFYKELMFISYNEDNAKVSGVPTKSINFMFTIITALTVAIASKIVGALIVSSLMVIPVAFALQVAKSYKTTLLYAILNSMASTAIGLYLSYALGLGPGGSIVLVSIFMLLLALLFKFLNSKVNKHFSKNTK